jgi:hypothetical protein
MAEEKRPKRVFGICAKYANGRISIGSMLLVHLLWFRPIPLCTRLTKKELQGSGGNFHFFREKSRFFMNLNFFGNFRNFGRICGVRPFGHTVRFFSAFSIITKKNPT